MTRLSLGIRCNVLTPLAQIDPSQASGANSKGELVLKTRKIKKAFNTGQTNEDDNSTYDTIEVPIYSGNGFRGALRRKMAEIMAQASIDKGLTLTRENFHLFFAGGGNNFASCKYEDAIRIKKLNPLVSLFGAGLAIEGKLTVSDLTPVDIIKKDILKENGNKYNISYVIGKQTYISKDDIADQNKYTRFLSQGDIDEWVQTIESEREKRKQKTKDDTSDNERTKRTVMQTIYTKEFIVPGIELVGSIGSKTELTEVEQGLLLKALVAMCYEQLGSSKNIGWGYVNYDVYDKFDGNSEDYIIQSKRNPNLLADVTVSFQKKGKYADTVKAADKWLNNIKQENISIAEIFKK